MPLIIKTKVVADVQEHKQCLFLEYFPLLKKNVFLLHIVIKTLNYMRLQAAASADLVWFGLFVHPFSHIRNVGHVNYRLQFTTQLMLYPVRTQ